VRVQEQDLFFSKPSREKSSWDPNTISKRSASKEKLSVPGKTSKHFPQVYSCPTDHQREEFWLGWGLLSVKRCSWFWDAWYFQVCQPKDCRRNINGPYYVKCVISGIFYS